MPIANIWRNSSSLLTLSCRSIYRGLPVCLRCIVVKAVWAQTIYVVRVVLQSLKYSWQTALYFSATIETLSTTSIFSLSSFNSSWPLWRNLPFSTGEYMKVLSRYRPTKRILEFPYFSTLRYTWLLKEKTISQFYSQCRPSYGKQTFKNTLG